jgi:hypothetical protein
MSSWNAGVSFVQLRWYASSSLAPFVMPNLGEKMDNRMDNGPRFTLTKWRQRQGKGWTKALSPPRQNVTADEGV